METDSIQILGDVPLTSFTFEITDIVLCITLALLLMISALVSASEVAFFSLTPSQLRDMRNRGHEKTLGLCRKSEKLLATILVTNNFVNVGIVIISSWLVNSLFDFSNNPVMAFIIQVIVVTFIILLFGEIIPKLYSNRNQEKVAIFMTAPLILLSYICAPISYFLIRFTSLISKRISKKNNISIDQLSKALDLTDETEINEEKDILKGIVRFSNIYAADIIQPRINVVAIDKKENFAKVKELIVENSYSRMPVYMDNLDNIVGILYIKDLLPYLKENDDFSWQKLVRKAYFVPETKKINDLLEEFQQRKVHLAIVVDEYGGTSGIVTMEDILEEIVGDINDETDEKDNSCVRLANGAFIFDGSILLNDFEKIVGLKPDYFKDVEGEADTLAGLILEIKGEIPHNKDVVIFHNKRFTILDVDNRRIKKIKYEVVRK